MRWIKRASVLVWVVVIGLFMEHVSRAGDPAPALPALKIGILHSFLGGSENAALLNQAGPLTEVLGSQLGVRLNLTPVPDAAAMSRQLLAGELDLGVMHGIEYAWQRQVTPQLKPIALAMNETIKLRALVIVPTSDPAKSIADLRGTTVFMPRKCLHHCPLYTQKLIMDAQLDPCGFFSCREQCRNVDEVLDCLVDGKGRCALVDGLAWGIYQERKPGRAKKLRVLAESGYFPTAAVIAKEGGIDDGRMAQIKAGFTTLHEKPMGRQMLMFWRLTQFVPVPAEYEALLQDIVREIPTALPEVPLFQKP